MTTQDVKNQTLTTKDVANGSLKAKDLKPGTVPVGARWALVNAQGQIEAQSGGFTVAAAYPTLPNTLVLPADNSLRANGNVYINANEPLGNNGIIATIALQNTVDQNGDAVVNGRAAGDDPTLSSPARSRSASAACPAPRAPLRAPLSRTCFVVSPRLSNGSFTGDNNRKRFYVVITGNSSPTTSSPDPPAPRLARRCSGGRDLRHGLACLGSTARSTI